MNGRKFDPDPAAAALHAVRVARGTVAPLQAAIAPRTEAEGAAVQYARARLAASENPAGFKIGATGKRMQEYLGLSGPAAGFMAAGNVHASGARLLLADYGKPGVECELAVRLARDLPPGPCSREQAMEAAGDLLTAIELVDNRYGTLKELGTPTLIADQVFHAAAILGPTASPDGRPIDWRRLDIPALAGRILIDGQERESGIAAELLGHPLQCLAWLAASPVAAAFGGLKAGQVILLGSVTPPIWLQAPGHIRVEFPPLPPVELLLV